MNTPVRTHKTATAVAREVSKIFEQAVQCMQFEDGVAGKFKDGARGVQLLEQAAAQGHAQAQLFLGDCFHDQFGHAVLPDQARAITLLQQAADQGIAEAQMRLGHLYHFGADGIIVKDEQRAFALYLQAAQQGLAKGVIRVGGCFKDGIGVVQDQARAVKLYEQVVRQGGDTDGTAQYNLGVCINNGEGAPKDACLAAIHFAKAAKRGHVLATYSIACCFRDGNGVAQDELKAAKHMRQAADQGDVNAQNCLGNLYLRGIGVAMDAHLAVHWWQLAANQGDPRAQMSLANFLFHGSDGVPQNIPLAYKFCKLATSRHQLLHDHSGIEEDARLLLAIMKRVLEHRVCAACAAIEPEFGAFKKCVGCNSVHYCGTECQRAHWRYDHKCECKQLAAKVEAAKRGVFASIGR